jgi:hypothetical protein
MKATNRMKELMQILHDGTRRYAVGGLWRSIGRPFLTIAIGILVAVGIVHGESWAIRQAPLLLTGEETYSQDASCVPDESAGDGMLPVAILH